jgi:apolipoprotein N-acyltransferase
MALSYPPVNCGGLIWFALTPLICAVWFRPGLRTGRRAFALGYVAGVVFFTATFYWLNALGVLFAAPLLRGLPLLLALYLALYPACFAWFLDRILVPRPEDRVFPDSWRNLALGALGACAWTALEWTRGWLLSGFGWNGLGVALHDDLPMIQVADLTGVLGLSWLVAFVNLMLVIVVRRIAGELGVNFLKRIRWEFSLSVSLVVFVFSYGLRAIISRGPPPPATAHIVTLQPNIPQQEKFDRAIEDEVFARLERLTHAADALRPDLILWPEAATPRGIFADQVNWDFIQRITDAASCPLLVGTVEDYIEGEHPGAYNSAILLTRDLPPEKLPTYRKTHLVPFGEYLPLRPLLGWIAGGLVPSDISPGTGIAVLDTPVGKIAPLICFEDTLGDLTRSFVARDAQLLVNLTNDGWFLRTAGAEQHLANAIFRAVENRRPLLRCTNTGITCLIDTHGFVDRGRLRAFEQGLSNFGVHVASNPSLTFYTRHGDWIAWLSLVFAAAAIVRNRLGKRTR